MGLSIGIYQTVTQARDWQILNNLTFPVLADSTEEVTSLFTYAPPWVAIIDDGQILQFTDVSYEDSTVDILISVLDTLWTPEIGASASVLDFGQVEAGQTSEMSLVVENIRTGILNVTSASISGEGFSCDFTPGEIYAVDDSLVIPVYFTPLTNGTFSGEITIESEVGTLTIPLSGSGFGAGVEDFSIGNLRQFNVSPAYPNPFNNETTLSFSLPSASIVHIEILNLNGEIVKRVFSGAVAAGEQQFSLSADDFASGIYFCRFSADGFSGIQKLVIIK